MPSVLIFPSIIVAILLVCAGGTVAYRIRKEEGDGAVFYGCCAFFLNAIWSAIIGAVGSLLVGGIAFLAGILAVALGVCIECFSGDGPYLSSE